MSAAFFIWWTIALPPRPDDATTLFLLEDDLPLAKEILLAFAAEGLAVEHVDTPAALRAIAKSGRARVLVMDRMIGDFDSLALVEEMRADDQKVGVVIISSRATVDDRIEGLRKGGDDYLVKPFAMGELIARVGAQLRRAGTARETRIEVASVILDRIDRTVRRGDRIIGLPPREFRLLEYLMLNRGQVVTRAMLLENVWNFRAATQTNVVDVHVGNLRRKLEEEGEARLIETVPGKGFTFVGDGPG